MSLFSQLPVELRLAVYEKCLLHNEEIIPTPTQSEIIDWRNPYQPITTSILPTSHLVSPRAITYNANLPSIALLAVSKATRCETLQVLLGQNTWRLSDPHDYALNTNTKRIWHRYWMFFRRVSTSFSMLDVNNSERLGYRRYFGMTHAQVNEADGSNNCKRFIHDLMRSRVSCVWHVKLELLAKMKLDEVVLCVRDVYCADGCCRWGPLKNLLMDALSGEWGLRGLKGRLRVDPGVVVGDDGAYDNRFRLRAISEVGASIVIAGLASEQERNAVARYVKAEDRLRRGHDAGLKLEDVEPDSPQND